MFSSHTFLLFLLVFVMFVCNVANNRFKKKEHYKETFNFDKKGNIKTHEYSVVGHVDCTRIYQPYKYLSEMMRQNSKHGKKVKKSLSPFLQRLECSSFKIFNYPKTS